LTVTLADDDQAAFTSTGIETMTIRSTGGTAGDGADVDLEMGDVTGVTTFQFSRLNEDVSLANVDSLSAVIKVVNTATAADVIIDYDASVVTGTSDSVSVTIENSTGGGDLTVNGVETLALTAVGADNDLNVDGDDLATVTVAGSGELNVDVDASVTTLNASGNSGGVTVNLTAAAAISLTGGTGNDTFSMGITLDTTDTVAGGTGTDTLVVNNTNGNALAVIPASVSVTGIETLRIEATDDSAADAFTLDASRVSFDTIIIDVSDKNDTYTLTNVTDEAIQITESANDAIDLINVSLATATGTADSLTLTVTNADATNAFIVDDINSTGGGIETLNLVLNQGVDITGGADIRVDDISSTHTTVNISGAADATFGTDVALTATTINGGSSTGDLVINLGTANQSVTGGTGNDTFAFAGALTSSDTVVGGAGNDTLTATPAAGAAAATISGVETATLTFSTAGATFSGANVSTDLTTINLAAASAEHSTLTALKSAVSTIRVGGTSYASSDNVTVTYAAGSSSAHTVVVGDSADSPADVDTNIVTIAGNAGALTINADGATGNSVGQITANTATSLTITTEEDLEVDSGATAGTGTVTASAATSVTMRTAGGVLLVDGAQTFAAATAITLDAADGNLTLTGAMTAAAATSLTVTASAGNALEQTGNFVSDADVTSVNLTATGASATIRYNGILDVDHVRTINMTATSGGAVTVDDIELLGLDNDAATDITSTINVTANGEDSSGNSSTVTISAINTAAATLDSLVVTTDADGTASITTGASNLTITAINASASAGTLTLDASTLGAATEITTGSGTNSITTDNGFADTLTLAVAAGTDTINITADNGGTSAADVITNFEAGADGDVLSLTLADLDGTGADPVNGSGTDVTSALAVNIQTDADGTLTLSAATNIIKVTDTVADLTALVAALHVTTASATIADNDNLLVLWTNGASTFLSRVQINDADPDADAGAGGNADTIDAYDQAEILAELVGVAVTDVTAANFAFV